MSDKEGATDPLPFDAASDDGRSDIGEAAALVLASLADDQPPDPVEDVVVGLPSSSPVYQSIPHAPINDGTESPDDDNCNDKIDANDDNSVVQAVGISPQPIVRKLTMTATDEEKYDDGYNSDGDVGPFFDAVNNEPDAKRSCWRRRGRAFLCQWVVWLLPKKSQQKSTNLRRVI